jgi:hypothetical protein
MLRLSSKVMTDKLPLSEIILLYVSITVSLQPATLLSTNKLLFFSHPKKMCDKANEKVSVKLHKALEELEETKEK